MVKLQKYGERRERKNMQDNEIIRLFFERDENAISEVSEKYGRELIWLSKNITGSAEDAEECVNDTYSAVWNRIPPEDPKYLYAYLAAITRNISLERYRRNSAGKRSAVTLELEEEIAADIVNGGDFTDGIALTDALNSFMRTLDRESRLLFLRRYYYADTLSELSGITGISENNLAVRLLRIRKKLAEHLKKEGFEV